MTERTPRIFQVAFLKGIRGTDGILAESVPQVAFLGRSNAGKSSTINALLGAEVAKTSARPGKTTEINIFDVFEGKKGHWRVMDLPGYGWSRVREKEREKLRKLILWYLSESGAHPKVVLIVDSMIPPAAFDIEAVKLCGDLSLPILILANKIDRLNQKEFAASLKRLTESFQRSSIVPFSAKKRINLEEARDQIFL